MNNNLLLRILIILGAVNSLYLLFTKYNCLDCLSVHNTIWGQPFGIPVAAIGTIGFAMIYILVNIRMNKEALMLSIMGTVISSVLIFAQHNLIHGYCLYCHISFAIMAIICVLLIKACYNNLSATTSAIILVGILIFTVNFQFISTNISLFYTQNKNNETIPISTNVVAGSVANADKVPANFNETLCFYDENNIPVEVNINSSSIMFFSSGCKQCDQELKKISTLEEVERPLLIATFISPDTNASQEIKDVKIKLSTVSLLSDGVLYDFDRINPINTVPIWVNK